jgi:hypothetical protein
LPSGIKATANAADQANAVSVQKCTWDGSSYTDDPTYCASPYEIVYTLVTIASIDDADGTYDNNNIFTITIGPDCSLYQPTFATDNPNQDYVIFEDTSVQVPLIIDPDLVIDPFYETVCATACTLELDGQDRTTDYGTGTHVDDFDTSTGRLKVYAEHTSLYTGSSFAYSIACNGVSLPDVFTITQKLDYCAPLIDTSATTIDDSAPFDSVRVAGDEKVVVYYGETKTTALAEPFTVANCPQKEITNALQAADYDIQLYDLYQANPSGQALPPWMKFELDGNGKMKFTIDKCDSGTSDPSSSGDTHCGAGPPIVEHHRRYRVEIYAVLTPSDPAFQAVASNENSPYAFELIISPSACATDHVKTLYESYGAPGAFTLKVVDPDTGEQSPGPTLQFILDSGMLHRK